MRLSRYNVYYESDANTTIVYNTLSDKFEILAKDIDSSIIKPKLISKGILTSSTEEEIAECQASLYSFLNRPVMGLTIITTEDCNLDCLYCAQQHVPKYMPQPTYDSIKNLILRKIYDFTCLNITLFGGEPTLAIEKFLPFLEEINEICSYYKKKKTCSIVTNGLELTSENVNSLYEAGVHCYVVTLDGDPVLHDRYRRQSDGSPSFLRIYSNLLQIKNNLKNLKQLRVIIRLSITKATISNINNWSHLYSDLLSDRRFSIELNRIENRGGTHINEVKTEILSNIDLIDLQKRINQRINAHIFPQRKLKANQYVCSFLTNMSYTIGVNGEVKLCSKLYSDNNIGLLLPNGTISLVHKKSKYLINNQSSCINCAFLPICHGMKCGIEFICPYLEIEDTLMAYFQYSWNITLIRRIPAPECILSLEEENAC